MALQNVMEPPEDKDIVTSDLFLSTFEEFLSLDSRIPLFYVTFFMAVAREPGNGPTYYASKFKTNQQTASRILAEIGTRPRIRKERLGLVDYDEHPEFYRQQQYLLTPKGRALWTAMLNRARSAINQDV